MIIAAIVVLAGVVLAFLASKLVMTDTFDLQQVFFTAAQMWTWVRDGAAFVKTFFIVPQVFDVLVTSYIAVLVLYEGYKFAMWLMTKIPMFGVSDN